MSSAPVRPVRFARRGAMEVRLAANAAEVKAAQSLRYRVFYEEMSATADAATRASGLDSDRFDPICDHLLVVDHDATASVVGCYRLLRQEIADKHGGFYTADEYDIQPLLRRRADSRFLELGRSCVLAPYRTRATMDLLWHGIASYVALNDLDVMFGCASFAGTDPEALALPLSYLTAFHRAPPEWRARALENHYVPMDMIPPDDIDKRAGFRALPPVIRGYVRLGGFVGDGAVIDPQFRTTDVLIVIPVENVREKYATRYARPDDSSGETGGNL